MKTFTVDATDANWEILVSEYNYPYPEDTRRYFVCRLNEQRGK